VASGSRRTPSPNTPGIDVLLEFVPGDDPTLIPLESASLRRILS
jgi:hypothetical protein